MIAQPATLRTPAPAHWAVRCLSLVEAMRADDPEREKGALCFVTVAREAGWPLHVVNFHLGRLGIDLMVEEKA